MAQVCAGFVAAERLFGMDKVWQAIDTSEMPEAARIQLFDRAAAALRPQIADLLRASQLRLCTLNPRRSASRMPSRATIAARSAASS